MEKSALFFFTQNCFCIKKKEGQSMYKKYFLRNELGEISIGDLCTSIRSAIYKDVISQYGKYGDIVWSKCINKSLDKIDTWIPSVWDYVKII